MTLVARPAAQTIRRREALVESRIIYLSQAGLPVPLRCAQFIQVRRPIDTHAEYRAQFYAKPHHCPAAKTR